MRKSGNGEILLKAPFFDKLNIFWGHWKIFFGTQNIYNRSNWTKKGLQGKRDFQC